MRWSGNEETGRALRAVAHSAEESRGRSTRTIHDASSGVDVTPLISSKKIPTASGILARLAELGTDLELRAPGNDATASGLRRGREGASIGNERHAEIR